MTVKSNSFNSVRKDISLMDDHLYWVALHGVEGVGPATFRRILDRFGGPKAAMEAPRRELISVRGLSDSVIRGVTEGRYASGGLEDTKRLLKILQKNGIKIITQGTEEYPVPLGDMKNPPVVLYVNGKYLQRDKKAVAIVGTTRPTEKGLWIARESARRLVEMGYTIVSGYARGLDTAAHLGALEAGGRTILALPMGMLRFFWRREFQPFIGRGTLQRAPTNNYLILSDCFPTEGWHVGAAMSRNRLIASLSRAVLVVETEVGGGAVYTAEFARGMGRKIFTLRYRNTPPTAKGNQLLLERGAIPVTNFKELEECMTNL